MNNQWRELFPFVRKPAKYIGKEVNSIKKDLAQVRLTFALAFPDMYEVGMSHLGIQILYSILNNRDDVACERVFCPGLDMEEIMRENGALLSSLESSLPLREFDVLGFSLQYELSYTNVINMLDLSGIPVYSDERDFSYPLVIGGGPMALNPEPVADFFDAFLLGEGEEAILEIVDVVMEGKDKGWKKSAVLERLSHIHGVYVPSFFDVSYHKDGTVKEITSLLSGYDGVEKRILRDLESAHYPVRPIVPFIETVHDRLSIEIARGCTKGCRFCQAGFSYRPIRERSPVTIMKLVKETLKNTGYDDVSLLSLSTGDYSCAHELILEMMDVLSRDKVALSFPSLRVGTVSPLFFEQVKRVRKTGLTLAPEAGTSRLRKVINKEMDESHLKKIAKSAFDEGWKAIKLYFMIGLPTETDDDLEGIVRLAKEVQHSSKSGRATVKVNVSTFVPKAHTPFQRFPQISLEETKRKQNFIRDKLGRRLAFRGHDPKMSLLEGIFSRGDRRLGAVIHKAFSLGCRLDGWKENFNFDRWQEAFIDSGINADFYLNRNRDNSECLPWNHLSNGVSEDFLATEYKKGVGQDISEDCRIGKCERCGVCDFKRIKNIVYKKMDGETYHYVSRPRDKANVFPRPKKVRVRFSKSGELRFLGHLDLVTLFSRALRRADIPFSCSNGFHPLPRIVFGEALPVGFESLDEYVDIELERFLTPATVLKGLKKALPDGIDPLSIELIPINSPPISALIKGGKYIVSFSKLTTLNSDLRRWYPVTIANKTNRDELYEMIDYFLGKEEILCVQKREKGDRRFNLRPFVKSIALNEDNDILISLEKIGDKTIRPSLVVQSLFKLSEGEANSLRILKTETLLRTSGAGYQELAMASRHV